VNELDEKEKQLQTVKDEKKITKRKMALQRMNTSASIVIREAHHGQEKSQRDEALQAKDAELTEALQAKDAELTETLQAKDAELEAQAKKFEKERKKFKSQLAAEIEAQIEEKFKDQIKGMRDELTAKIKEIQMLKRKG